MCGISLPHYFPISLPLLTFCISSLSDIHAVGSIPGYSYYSSPGGWSWRIPWRLVGTGWRMEDPGEDGTGWFGCISAGFSHHNISIYSFLPPSLPLKPLSRACTPVTTLELIPRKEGRKEEVMMCAFQKEAGGERSY